MSWLSFHAHACDAKFKRSFNCFKSFTKVILRCTFLAFNFENLLISCVNFCNQAIKAPTLSIWYSCSVWLRLPIHVAVSLSIAVFIYSITGILINGKCYSLLHHNLDAWPLLLLYTLCMLSIIVCERGQQSAFHGHTCLPLKHKIALIGISM